MERQNAFFVIRLFLGIVIFCLLLVQTFISLPNNEWHGFGVDSQNKVYIGKQNEIIVYIKGKKTTSIPIPPFRTYYFTVSKDDTILLSTSLKIFIFDSEGNQLSCEPDVGNSMYDKLRRQKSTEVNGETFYLKSDVLGKYSVIDEQGTVLFSESESLSVIDRLIPCIILFSGIIFLLSFLVDIFVIRRVG